MKPKYAKLTNISSVIFSLFNILLDCIALCPIIQQERRRSDAATYRRITNNTFYRPAKIKLYI